MALYQLLINGTNVLHRVDGPQGVNAQPAAYASLMSFTRNYDEPTELIIRFHAPWQRPPYAADSQVVLKVDNVIRFRGLLDVPQPVASDSRFPEVEYYAYDHRNLLANHVVEDADGNGSLPIPAGTVKTQVDRLLEIIGERLTALGISTTVEYVAGAAVVSTLPVSLEHDSIDGAFQAIAQAAPGVRLIMKPGLLPTDKPYYSFVRIYAATAYDLMLDVPRIPELQLRQSLKGRAGAVKTKTGSTIGTAENVEDWEEHALDQYWDSAKQALWIYDDAFTKNASGVPGTNRSDVYRLFSFEAIADQITPGTRARVLVKTMPDFENDANSKWQEVKIQGIDWENSRILLKQPAVLALSRLKGGRINPNDPGRTRPAVVKIRYAKTGSASTPITINSQRFPESGYAGRVFQLAPITCGYDKIIEIPGGVDKEKFVVDAWAAFSEPLIIGSLPILGEMPADLWDLQRRINIKTESHGETGYEALLAPLLSYTLAWGPSLAVKLDFNRDDSEKLVQGAAMSLVTEVVDAIVDLRRREKNILKLMRRYLPTAAEKALLDELVREDGEGLHRPNAPEQDSVFVVLEDTADGDGYYPCQRITMLPDGTSDTEDEDPNPYYALAGPGQSPFASACGWITFVRNEATIEGEGEDAVEVLTPVYMMRDGEWNGFYAKLTGAKTGDGYPFESLAAPAATGRVGYAIPNDAAAYDTDITERNEYGTVVVFIWWCPERGEFVFAGYEEPLTEECEEE